MRQPTASPRPDCAMNIGTVCLKLGAMGESGERVTNRVASLPRPYQCSPALEMDHGGGGASDAAETRWQFMCARHDPCNAWVFIHADEADRETLPKAVSLMALASSAVHRHQVTNGIIQQERSRADCLLRKSSPAIRRISDHASPRLRHVEVCAGVAIATAGACSPSSPSARDGLATAPLGVALPQRKEVCDER